MSIIDPENNTIVIASDTVTLTPVPVAPWTVSKEEYLADQRQRLSGDMAEKDRLAQSKIDTQTTFDAQMASIETAQSAIDDSIAARNIVIAALT